VPVSVLVGIGQPGGFGFGLVGVFEGVFDGLFGGGVLDGGGVFDGRGVFGGGVFDGGGVVDGVFDGVIVGVGLSSIASSSGSSKSVSCTPSNAGFMNASHVLSGQSPPKNAFSLV
jgi:hypothetical protein